MDIIASLYVISHHKAKPLYEFAHKNTEFIWQDKHTNAVNQLKEAITSPDCLVIFNPDLPTTLTTDACDYAMGACLTQTYEQGERPVAFISKTFNDTEMKYTLWEKELYAVIWSVHQFRPYLLNIHFTIRSDNKPTTQVLVSSSLRTSTTTTNRVNRWILSLQPFKFTIQHHPGKSNVVADALSRYPNVKTEYKTSCNAVITTFHSSLRNRLIDLYAKHISTTHIWQQLHKEALHPRLQLIDDLICTRTNPPRILIPDDTSFRHDLIHEIHDTVLSGHPGIHKLLSFISLRYVGNHIRRDILEYVNTCPECQKAKPRHEKPFGICTPLPIAHTPWTDISMDLIMSLPTSNDYNAIFVVVDRFSKMAHFIPTQTTVDAPQLARLFLDNIVKLHGFPKSIVSDRDPRFVSIFWKEVWNTIGTSLRISTANHPQTDGQTERTNRTLEQYLRIYARHKKTKWSTYLPFAEFAYNNTTHSATGLSPSYIVYQRHLYTPIDIAISDITLRNANAETLLTTYSTLLERVRKQLDNARIKMIMQNQSNDKPSPFNVDDQVLVHRTAFRNFSSASHIAKFDDRWLGPFMILEIINHNAYRIDLPSSLKAHNVINISFLRPYKISMKFQRLHPDNLLLPPVESDDITSSSSSNLLDDTSPASSKIPSITDNIPSASNNQIDEYEVESILKCRLSSRTHKYTPRQRSLPLQQQLHISKDPKEYDYLVKWKGYPSYEATWEPYEHLEHADEVFNSFVLDNNLPLQWKITPNTSSTQDSE